MKKVNSHIYFNNISASPKINNPSIKDKILNLQKKLFSRCEKEVPENGIFTPVIEKEKTENAIYIIGCEYSKNQTSDKKDLRTLYFTDSETQKEKQTLIEGTIKEILEYLKNNDISEIIIPDKKSEIEKHPLPNIPYGIIPKKKSVAFGSNEVIEPFNRKEAIEDARKKYTPIESDDSITSMYYSMNEQVFENNLRVLDLFETGVFTDKQVQHGLAELSDMIDTTEQAIRIAKLDDEQYERLNNMPKLLGFQMTQNFALDIAELDREKFNKFIEIYNKRADENSYRNSYTAMAQYYTPTYETYCQKYCEHLLPIFRLETPLYEQSTEFLDKGIEPIFLYNIQNTILDDKEKERVYILTNQQIMPKPEILKLDNDVKFELASRFAKEINGFPIEGIIEKAHKYGSNEKTGKRFIEIFDKYIQELHIFFYNSYSNDKNADKYESYQLEDIDEITQLNDIDYERAKELIQKGIPYNQIPECINCDLQDSQIDRALNLLEEEIPSAIRIASDDKLYKKYMQLRETTTSIAAGNIVICKEEEEDYEKYKAQGLEHPTTLSKLYGKKLQRALSLIEKGNQWITKDILDEKTYLRILELLEKGVSVFQTNYLAKLNDTDYQKAIHLFESKVPEIEIPLFLELDEEQYKKALGLMDRNTPIYIVLDAVMLNEEQYEHFLECLENEFNSYDCIPIAKLPSPIYEKTVDLIKKGITYQHAMKITALSSEKYNKVISLLEQGCEESKAIEAMTSQEEYDKQIKNLNDNKSELRDLFNSEDYKLKLKKYSQGKYQTQIMEMFDADKMKYSFRKSLIDSKMTETDFLSSLQKFSKSTFKLAYDTPNQYLSGIDVKYTEKVNGKYPQLPENVKKEQQKQIKKFFQDNICEVFRALKYLDTDTVNQMMDKRTHIFKQSLKDLNSLTDENFQILSDLTKCKSKETGKILTAKEKIEFCRMMQMFQKCVLDTAKLSEMSKTGFADIKEAKKIIQEKILDNAGFSKEEIEELSKQDLKFNNDYMYTLLINDEEVTDIDLDYTISWLKEKSADENTTRGSILEELTEEMTAPEVMEIILDVYDNINTYSDEKLRMMIKNAIKIQKGQDDLYVVVRESVKRDFQEFISDTSNKYGRINQQTKEDFISNGLNYNEWLNPSVDDEEFNINKHNMKIKMWDRNPYEDLFIGNKTSCCTAIGTGGNGSATPAYLLSQAYNVVELYDEQNNAVGMSRIFTANVNNKPSVIMDNIELNQNFLKVLSDDDTTEVRNKFFKYINKIAEKVTGDKDSQVYFSTSYLKVPTDDLETTEKTMKFIGEISQDRIYLNCKKGWINPKEMDDKPTELYVIPKK